MRIQHNIMAMNSYRNYSSNTSALSKNLEKLSSGYKINRAGDDAAGLAISEKMRAQITGLKTAQKNAKDGISLVQTAEGALTEVHDMLNRMVELADQSANGTYDDGVDRDNLQKEFDALRTEIDRIADASNFNGINLLDGSLAAKVTTTNNTYDTSAVNALGSAALPATAAAGSIGTNTITYKKGTEEVKTKFEVDLSDLKWNAAATGEELTITVGSATFTLTATGAGEQDINALLDAAVTASGTKDVTGSGSSADDFTVSFANGKLTFELKGGADGVSTNNALKANWDVEVAVAATSGATATGVITGSNWNAGTTVLKTGAAGAPDRLANTVITATNLGMSANVASNDGFSVEIDGKKYVLAAASDSKWNDYAGNDYIVVKSSATDVKGQLQDLANAITDNSTTWTAGVNAAGTSLTLAQKSGTSGTGLTSRADIAAGIKTGKVTFEAKEATAGGKPLTLQIGDTADSYNQLTVAIADTHAAALGIDAANVNISDQGKAQNAIKALKDAINSVSSTRGGLGATQNRLEHTINNLSVMQENIQDAEASIRDVDVAEEMMDYTKNNILVQSAQAMLAQANQVPQGVLQLLQ